MRVFFDIQWGIKGQTTSGQTSPDWLKITWARNLRPLASFEKIKENHSYLKIKLPI